MIFKIHKKKLIKVIGKCNFTVIMWSRTAHYTIANWKIDAGRQIIKSEYN